jgi:hypothetical protein
VRSLCWMSMSVGVLRVYTVVFTGNPREMERVKGAGILIGYSRLSLFL